jgi:putative sigma-54 modulation protein
MKFEYTGRHIEVTPALRSHVEGHFNRITHLFGDKNHTKAHVIIEVEKGRHRSEIIFSWQDHVLSANSVVSDMYQSLTKTIDKIEKQALKIKNKVIAKHQKEKKPIKFIPLAEELAPEPELPKVINAGHYAIKPITEEEAIMQLKREENQFLVYRDAETERISVIYNRKDGNYGLIQP